MVVRDLWTTEIATVSPALIGRLANLISESEREYANDKTEKITLKSLTADRKQIFNYVKHAIQKRQNIP